MICFVGLVSMTGCETVNGMGKDISNCGQAIFGPHDTDTGSGSSGGAK